jgi:hypothetical protein
MSLALPAMSSRAPSAGLSVTSMPVAPSCAASTASVQSPEPDARRRASSSTPQASGQGMAAPPPLQGALMESLRLQCQSLRCRRRTPSAAKAAHVVDVVFNRSTGSRCPLERQCRRSKRLTTGLRLRPDTALPHASTATPSLRSYADVTTVAPRPIGSGALPPRLRGRTLPFIDSSAWDRPGCAQQSSSRGWPRCTLAGGPPWPAPRGHGRADAGAEAQGRWPARSPWRRRATSVHGETVGGVLRRWRPG